MSSGLPKLFDPDTEATDGGTDPLSRTIYEWLGRVELEVKNLSRLTRPLLKSLDGQVLRRLGTAVAFGKILTSAITGTATNDSAAAGDLGEYREATIAAGSVSGWVTNALKDIGSIQLTAGDWLVIAEPVWTTSAGVTGTEVLAGLSTVSTTFQEGFGQVPLVPTTGTAVRVPNMRRVALPAAAPVFLVGRVQFTAGAPLAGAVIRAWRIR